MTSFLIVENVFRRHVRVVVEPNDKRAERELARWSKSFGGEDGKKLDRLLGCTLFPIRSPSAEVVVWIRHRHDVPTVVHEMLHAAFWILNGRGVLVMSDNDEALAYLQEYLVSSYLRRVGLGKLIER